MNANKAQQYIPQIRSDIDPASTAVRSQLTPQEIILISCIDGRSTLEELQTRAHLPLKELLLCIKTLTQKGIVSVAKLDSNLTPPPPSHSSSASSQAHPADASPSASALSPARSATPHSYWKNRFSSPLSAAIDELLGSGDSKDSVAAPASTSRTAPPSVSSVPAMPSANSPVASAHSTSSISSVSPAKLEQSVAHETPHSASASFSAPSISSTSSAVRFAPTASHPKSPSDGRPKMGPVPTQPAPPSAIRTPGQRPNLSRPVPRAATPEVVTLQEVPSIAQNAHPMFSENELLPTSVDAEVMEVEIEEEFEVEAEIEVEYEVEEEYEVEWSGSDANSSTNPSTPRVSPEDLEEEATIPPTSGMQGPPSRPSSEGVHALFERSDYQATLARKAQSAAVSPSLVSDILLSFARVLSCFQLYSPQNDAVRESLAELHGRLQVYLQQNPSLVLKVEPWTFVCDEQVVYSNTDRENSLAFKLYRDGVRALTLLAGFDSNELATLLQILAKTQKSTQQEDDIVTLFWKAEFKYAQIIAVEGFQLHTEREYEHPIDGLFAKLLTNQEEASHTQRQMTALEKLTLGSSHLAYFLDEEKPQELLQQLSITPATPAIPEKQTLLALQKELHPEHIPTYMGPLLLYFSDHPQLFQSTKQQNNLAFWLSSYAEYLLQHGHYEGLATLLRRAEQWAQDPLSAPFFIELGTSLSQLLQQEQTLLKLLSGLQIKEDEPIPQALLTLLQRNAAESTAMLFQLLQTKLTTANTRALRELLLALTQKDPQPFLQRLPHAEPDLCIQLLLCLREIATPAAIQAISEQIHHPSIDVQNAVMGMAEILSVGQSPSQYLRQVIMRLLDSDDPLERNRAYQVMEQSKDARWALLLLPMLQENQKLDRDELEAIARLSARLNPDATLNAVVPLAQPPGRLSIERSWRKNQRFAAISALAEIGNLKAEDALRKLVKLGQGDLKEAYIQGMRALRRERSGQSSSFLPAAMQASTAAQATDTQRSKRAEGSAHQAEGFDELHQQMLQALEALDLQSQDATNAQIRDEGAKFVTLFHVLTKTAGLYDANNKIFDRPVQEMLQIQHRMFQALPEIHMVGLNEQFYINDLRIRMTGANIKQVCMELCHEFSHRKLGGLIFREPLDDAQWRTLAQLFAGKAEGGKSPHWRILHQQIANAELDQAVSLVSEVSFRIGEQADAKDSLVHLYALGFEICDEVWDSCLQLSPPNPLPIRHFVHDLIDYILKNPRTHLEVLSFEDPVHPLKTHFLNTTLLSLRMGQLLRFSRTQLADLGVSAFFHDIGHILLIRLRQLGAVRWNHIQAGLQLFLQHRGFHEARLKRLLAILEHHQTFGSPPTPDGFPTPSLGSRIIQLADLFDTLTTQALLGGPPIPPSQVLQRLTSGQGQLFDPTILQALALSVGAYPNGTLIELTDGSLGISMGCNGQLDDYEDPRVLITRTGTLQFPVGTDVDLASNEFAKLRVKRAHVAPPDLRTKRILMEHLKQLHPTA